MFAFCGEAGALVARAPEEVTVALRDFGMRAGSAFQIADDLLDFESDAATLGKAVLADVTEGKPSRHHARISLAEGTVWLEDLGSTNGTYVNGRRVDSKVKLTSGDKLRFDVEEFVFRGYIQRQCQALCGNTVGASILQWTIFTQGHLYQGWLRLVPVLLIAIVLTTVALWRKSLVPGMVAHGVGDGLVALIFFFK